MSEPLFTLKMLAETLSVPIGALRLWQRRGLLQPKRSVGKLDYFDHAQFQNAKIFAKLYHAGLRSVRVADKIESLWRQLNLDTGASLELPIEIVGRDILYRKDDRLFDAFGQRLFAFEESAAQRPETTVDVIRLDRLPQMPSETSDDARARLMETAWDREDAGDLAGAIAVYRTIMRQCGLDAAICFQMAELFYRLGELEASRERYYMTLDLDEHFIEARANLGCVLAELGDLEAAAQTFEETLQFHPDYADVHFHLARVLEQLGQHQRAKYHRQLYDDLMPGDPWSNSEKM